MSLKLQCKHCPASSYSSPDVARIQGWRTFRGVSVTGKVLDDVVCPGCAGSAPEPARAEPSWSVRCKTCDWEWEDEDGDGPLTAKAAKQLARDHECEPWIEIATPEGRWLPPRHVNDDGSLTSDDRIKTLTTTGDVL